MLPLSGFYEQQSADKREGVHTLEDLRTLLLVFINSGRGRGRRWCNMATCGNRHKVEAHRERKTKSPKP